MRRLLLLALPLSLMACGSDSGTTITVATLAGTWNLTTANGTALPFTIATTPAKVELLSASVVVTSTGAFTGTEQTRTTVGTGTPTTATLPIAGTISVSGTLVTVTLTGSAAASGTLISSTQFSFKDPTTGATFVFVKL
jgi:hypothetical protein